MFSAHKAWKAAAFGVHGHLNFTKSGFIEHSKKFNEEDMKLQLDGKNCVVTGANSGIGYAAAEALAFRGGNVYMVCRNKERGEIAVSKVQSVTGNKNVYLELCDLSSISHIKSWASRFISRKQPVHVLVNNAGLLEKKRITTSEGLELNFAVNVAGTFSLTELMVPLLEKAEPDARVITVSSDGMYTAPLTEDLQFSERIFDGDVQYARTKRVQVALTERWAKLYGEKGIVFYSMHPGWAMTPGVVKGLPELCKSMSWMLRTSDEGADTIVWLALQPKEKLVSGAFYFDRAKAPKHLHFAGNSSGSHIVIDSIADSLYSLCQLPKIR
ncbi:dehydrogenase/reductase SDR family member 12-like [Papaver somniferum]|uniref:dehydrogenase/reductase SDR family member 12-like n=1 Tax=Papaver somniferum TaxID=3469 RepID=UPI000E6F470A|nr:dehydrogenase/reductase SDR family member 12-like [Papaver somniferum]